MNIGELKKELAVLGAKTTGPKKVLERRLAVWKERGLHKTLLETNVINVGEPKEFPANSCFKPLTLFTNEKIIDYSCIETWFNVRKAKKGKEKGRILALKLFIKFTQIAKEGNIYFVKGKCCAEQKKNAEYMIKMVISTIKKPEIQQCSCSCPAGTGVSAACKHIGAMCFSLEYFCVTGKVQEYISCTSEAVAWNKPLGRGIDYMSIFEITKQAKLNFTTDENYTNCTVNKLINKGLHCPMTNCRKSDVFACTEDHNYHFELDDVSDRLEVNSASASSIDLPHTSQEEENISIDLEYIDVLNTLCTNASKAKCLNDLQVFTLSKKCCQETYKSFIACSNVVQVALNTKNIKEEWQQQRQFRVTGSRCYSLYTYQKGNWEIKALKYFWPKGFTNKSMMYGLETEKEARECYKTSTGYTVYETGLIICKQHPWLAVSPDGIVMKDAKPIKLLEIKCPVIGKEKEAVHFIIHCEFLQVKDYRVVLKKKHAYYAQVQLGMAVLNLPECDFVIYSRFSRTCLNIIVKFDSEFVSDLLSRLQNVYFQNMFHVICMENKCVV